MESFREENKFIIYYVNIFGLYLKSIETLTNNKWVLWFFTVWTKIPTCLLPLYVAYDVRSLLFDKAPLLIKIAMGRKLIAFSGFLGKDVVFYIYRNKVEGLIDLWDRSFREEFFPEAYKVNRINYKKALMSTVRFSLSTGTLAALLYSAPAYLSKKKELIHPSGIIYPHKSPEFEIVVTYDVIVSLGCVSSAAFDCILVLFLSQVRSKLVFLRETLAHMINELMIDDEGRLLGRTPTDNDNQDNENTNSLQIEDSVDENGFYKGRYEEVEWKGERYKKNIEEFEKNMRIWILHHQQLIGFFEELKRVYSPLATFELVYIVSYTALTALHLVQVRFSLVALGIALVASSNVMSLFLWSTLGADVGETHLFTEAFGRNWFLYPKKIKTAFSFIIMRCKKPLTLYGISIYDINLVTFFELMKLTYQFFAFMVQLTH